ncbi:ankyrin [Gonapodya prolifera JEL478]|uniref:Ankyrin n=1 Tax=Gonapodya prolifera (strain JEL478) TaxID=1344416 RepID=A0A139AJK3_GONPJ|nr:ankyrin [Gonapodya prolifera JEL478]|eukprot:KXS16585.1 ankyrin [Gonapodya prolifera JEL478]
MSSVVTVKLWLASLMQVLLRSLLPYWTSAGGQSAFTGVFSILYTCSLGDLLLVMRMFHPVGTLLLLVTEMVKGGFGFLVLLGFQILVPKLKQLFAAFAFIPFLLWRNTILPASDPTAGQAVSEDYNPFDQFPSALFQTLMFAGNDFSALNKWQALPAPMILRSICTILVSILLLNVLIAEDAPARSKNIWLFQASLLICQIEATILFAPERKRLDWFPIYFNYTMNEKERRKWKEFRESNPPSYIYKVANGNPPATAVLHGDPYYSSPAHALCAESSIGNVAVLQHIRLVADVNVTSGGRSCNRALTEAASAGNLEAVCFLLEKGANIHFGSDEAVRYRSSNGYKDVVHLLLESGEDTITAILGALYGSQMEMFLFLVDWPVQLLDDHHFLDRLYTACYSGNVLMVELLLKHYPVNPSPTEFDHALNIAVERGDEPIIKYLLGHGADVHYDDDSAVISSSANGYLIIVHASMDHGADVTAQGAKADIQAARFGHKDILKQMKERGVDVDGILARDRRRNGNLGSGRAT